MTRNLERVIMCQLFRAFPNDVWSNPGIKTPGLGHAIVAAEHHGGQKGKKDKCQKHPRLVSRIVPWDLFSAKKTSWNLVLLPAILISFQFGCLSSQAPKEKKVGVKAGAQIKCLTQSLKSWACVVQQKLLPWLCQPRPQLVYRKLSFFKKSSGIQAFNLDAITKPTAPATTSGHTQPLVTASSSG